jgi:apolipoprotein N-acyltransferase
MVRSASKGLSAAFNYKGQVLASQDFFTSDSDILYSDVPVEGHKTVYSIIGDLLAWLCILFFVVISVVLIKGK